MWYNVFTVTYMEESNMYIDKINSVIDYIESHLTDEISYRELAALLAMSVYELRRIFV